MKAIKRIEGVFEREPQCDKSDLFECALWMLRWRTATGYWKPRWKLDEELGNFVAVEITHRVVQSRREALQVCKRLEVHRKSLHIIRLIPSFIIKRIWSSFYANMSTLEKSLGVVMRREEMNMGDWHRICLGSQGKTLDENITVFIKPSIFRKAQILQRKEPICLGISKEEIVTRFWWSYNDFWMSVGYSEKEARLLLWEKGRRQQRKFERLEKAMNAAREGCYQKAGREGIPEEVKLLVWERDNGHCINCGSAEDLEFDHIIPVSKGGSNTEKNIQLLCMKCNREKSDHIT